MGRVSHLNCPRCHTRYAAEPRASTCATCGVVLDLQVDLESLTPALTATIRARPRGLWRWHELLPIEDPAHIVSLGEGDTPLLLTPRLAAATEIERLYVKNDGLLPTGSLKDRVNTVAVSRAREVGARVVATPSTGNAGASVAAYAAAAGLSAVVLVPEATAPAKLAQARAHGARLVRVRGPFEAAAALFREAVAAFGWYSTLSTNPWRNEGLKTYAYEVWEALGRAPDWMIHPEASGLGVAATWKGFAELNRLGWVAGRPRMVAAQSAAAAPFVAALANGLEAPAPLEPGETVAESIRVGRPTLGWQGLEAIRASGGTAVAVTDEELLAAQALLASRAGIFAEPSAAASLAAAIRLRRDGVIGPRDLVVLCVTGHGLKQPGPVPAAGPPAPIAPDLEALRALLTDLPPA